MPSHFLIDFYIPQPKEIVILIDLAMSDSLLEYAKTATAHLLELLTARDKVKILVVFFCV